MRTLDVWIDNRKVAEFASDRLADGSESFIVSYETGAKTGDLISLTMVPYGDQLRFETKTFPPPFDMILPEGARRSRVLEARKLLPVDSFSLLSYVGGNPVNRVRFVPHGEEPNEKPTELPPPAEILHSGDGLKLFGKLIDDLDLRQGIAGVQPKILGRTSPDSSKISFNPRNYKGNTHILKASTTQYPFLAANEHFCLQVFREAGLPTVVDELSDDGQLLLVKRFDIADDGTKLGFEEAASLMGETSITKYERDYGTMIEVMARNVEALQEDATRRQLVLSILLNYLLGNGDAHLKNFGVLYRTDLDVALSPFYDCVSTVQYTPNDIPALALSFEHYSKAWWPRLHLEAFCRKYGNLKDSEVTALFEQAYTALANGIKRVLEEGPRIPGFRAQAEELAKYWDHRISVFRDSESKLQVKSNSSAKPGKSKEKLPPTEDGGMTMS